MQKTLFYVHDPMCSWCWGFEAVKQQLFDALAGKVKIQSILGGLAPDSEFPMPEAMQSSLQKIWRKIENTIPGTRFNYDFWLNCQARRSTYPANRAVIAARDQGQQFDRLMTRRIQEAYYLEAKNPSDNSVLIELAADIGLNKPLFADTLISPNTQNKLIAEIEFVRSLGINSFPSLLLQENNQHRLIQLNYNDVGDMLLQIETN